MSARRTLRRDVVGRVSRASRLLGVVAFAGAIAAAPAASRAQVERGDRPPARPNVILILADDLGYGDVGYQGCPDIPTPNIDALAASGVRFTDGYVTCAICTPSRAGLLTGRYQNRFGLETNPGPVPPQREEAGLPNYQITLAEMLKGAGYTTALVGKWHLGMLPGQHPMSRGFDEFFGFLHGAHPYFPNARRNEMLRGREATNYDRYLTEVLADEALAFIERRRAEPFFLYLAFNAVHLPLQATDKYLARVSDIKDEARRTYAAMMVALDDAVGRVIEKLDALHLRESTLVWFISDNGGVEAHARNLPLRGGKATYWEGGIRVPFLVSWPGRLPAGKSYTPPVITLDVVPTIAALTGAALPADRPIDGVNLMPYLLGENAEAPHAILFWRMFERRAVREGRWKLVSMGGGPWELYDLSRDAAEAEDLAAARPEIVERLNRAFAAWASHMAEPMWRYPSQAEINALGIRMGR